MYAGVSLGTPSSLSALDELIETDYANEQVLINTTTKEFSQSWK
jgi:hypothetical protein